MFGISPLGWLHTLGSLPAIPIAIYMLARYGRIVPRSIPGAIYFIAMMVGSLTVFLIAQQPISNGIGVVTLLLLLVGYGVGHTGISSTKSAYIERICLTLTVFLLMVPAVSETLRRVPVSDPIVSDPKSPILLGVLGVLLVALIIGLTLQII